MNAWETFRGGVWQQKIDVRDFIQQNYTPYEGDDAFLAPVTQRTVRLRNKLDALLAAGGVTEQEVAQALGAEAAPKFQLQVVFKCEPVWGAAAGHVVEKPVVNISQYVMKQCQAQQAGEVTDKEGGQQRAAKREMGMPPPFDQDVKDAGEEREGKKLQEVAQICVKEEILE